MNLWFANRMATIVPSPAEMTRRSTAIRAALAAYGCRDAAMIFLNRPCDDIDGLRPLDLAARDDCGLLAVMDVLRARCDRRS